MVPRDSKPSGLADEGRRFKALRRKRGRAFPCVDQGRRDEALCAGRVYNALQPLSPDLPRWMDPAIVAKTGTPRVEEDCDEEIEEEGEEEEVEVEVEVVVLKAEAVDEEGEVGGGAPHQREPAGLCLNKSDDAD